MKALKSIKHQDEAPLGMVEKQLTLKYRAPGQRAPHLGPTHRRADSKRRAEEQGRGLCTRSRHPRSTQRNHPETPSHPHRRPQHGHTAERGVCDHGVEVEGGINFLGHFNIELANGAEGYIPPPEQHLLGGYTTSPAWTAGLEVQAEPKILKTLLGGIAELSGRDALTVFYSTAGSYHEATGKSKPLTHWPLDLRLDERNRFQLRQRRDTSVHP